VELVDEVDDELVVDVGVTIGVKHPAAHVAVPGGSHCSPAFPGSRILSPHADRVAVNVRVIFPALDLAVSFAVSTLQVVASMIPLTLTFLSAPLKPEHDFHLILTLVPLPVGLSFALMAAGHPLLRIAVAVLPVPWMARASGSGAVSPLRSRAPCVRKRPGVGQGAGFAACAVTMPSARPRSGDAHRMERGKRMRPPSRAYCARRGSFSLAHRLRTPLWILTPTARHWAPSCSRSRKSLSRCLLAT
jgi:hypothetical protein